MVLVERPINQRSQRILKIVNNPFSAIQVAIQEIDPAAMVREDLLDDDGKVVGKKLVGQSDQERIALIGKTQFLLTGMLPSDPSKAHQVLSRVCNNDADERNRALLEAWVQMGLTACTNFVKNQPTQGGSLIALSPSR